MTLLLAPTPTVRQVLEAVFQLVVQNAPGSGVPPAQRMAAATAAERLLERLIEGRIREALARHIAAEGATFDSRVDARIDAARTVEGFGLVHGRRAPASDDLSD